MSCSIKSGYKITVVGAGYVGMSLALILSQSNKVTVLEKDEEASREDSGGIQISF